MKNIINTFKLILTDFISNKFKSFYQYFYFKNLRKRLKNIDFSLFSPNCYAGIIYHRLGLKFKSPTINLFFPYKKQYLKFLSNLPYYLSLELKEFDDGKNTCPVAMLGDVKIIFNHYKTFAEANQKWNERKKRVNYDKIYAILDDYVDIEHDDLIKFNKLNIKGKAILTAKKYTDINNIFQISKYSHNEEMKPYLSEISRWTGKCPADKDFDFVEWLNSN